MGGKCILLQAWIVDSWVRRTGGHAGCIAIRGFFVSRDVLKVPKRDIQYSCPSYLH